MKFKFGFMGFLFKTKSEKEKIRLDLLRSKRFESDSATIDDAVIKTNNALKKSK